MKGSTPGGAQSLPITITLVLQQSGPKVTGELSSPREQGRVEGVVNGDVLSFSEGIKGELAIDGDEMWGRFDHLFVYTKQWPTRCDPCYVRLRRVTSPVPAPSEPPARRP